MSGRYRGFMCECQNTEDCSDSSYIGRTIKWSEVLTVLCCCMSHNRWLFLFCRFVSSEGELPLELLFAMSSAQRQHLSHLLLTVLLVGGWTADGAQNGSEAEGASFSVSSRRHIVVKEGSSALIECNVTGGHDDIKWYNSKGPLLGEENMLCWEQLDFFLAPRRHSSHILKSFKTRKLWNQFSHTPWNTQ